MTVKILTAEEYEHSGLEKYKPNNMHIKKHFKNGKLEYVLITTTQKNCDCSKKVI